MREKFQIISMQYGQMPNDKKIPQMKPLKAI